MERKRVPKISLFDLRSSFGQNSSAKSKVNLLDEGYAWVPKMRDFTKNPKEGDFGKSKFSGLGGVLETSFCSTKLQEVEILLTLLYLPP